MIQQLPLGLHIAIETAAAASFILAPHRQLSSLSTEASLILKSYGGLLLATNILCLGIVLRPVFDDASRLVAFSMAFYHVWPSYRAYKRITMGVGMEGEQASNLGGPNLHLLLHVVLCVLLALVAVI